MSLAEARLTAIVVGAMVVWGEAWAVGGLPTAEGAAPVTSAPAGPTTEDGRLEILNGDSTVRVCIGLKTPVYATADGQIKTVTFGNKPVAEIDYLPAAGNWMQPDFDDMAWGRERLPLEIPRPWRDEPPFFSAATRHLICVRARFRVDDPAQAKDVRPSLRYIGGIVVYVNGKELARGHMPAGEIKPDTLAQAYLEDPYTDADGKIYDLSKDAARYALRWRTLEPVVIPSGVLRTGVNVLCIENHRAPIHEAQFKAKVEVSRNVSWAGRLAYVGLDVVSLTAAAGSAVQANTGRPQGFRVWTCAADATLSVGDALTSGAFHRSVAASESSGDPSEAPTVSIAVAQNGVFSGRLVVSSTEPIKGLQVEPGELVQPGGKGKIAASAVRIRYAELATPDKSWRLLRGASLFDALLDAAPAGAKMVPVWATVRIPADAAPGHYEGTLTVKAEGQKPVAVPFKVAVCEWRMPDPKDFRMHNLGTGSPDSLARHYGVQSWSEKHFEMMGQSLALMSEVGSRQVVMNMAIDWDGLGSNPESMVRWIRNADGSYRHDFTLFDKYLDIAAKAMGKPSLIRLNCWGEWVKGKDGKAGWASDGKVAGKVTLLDPATGQLSELDQPGADTPAFMDFWKPVLDEARKKLEARGWFDVTSLGHNGYASTPEPEVMGVAKKIWPDGTWCKTTHAAVLGALRPDNKDVSMPCVGAECVWREPPVTARGYQALFKPRRGIWCGHARDRHRDYMPLVIMEAIPEEMIMRGLDGVGQLGIDYFPIKNPKGGGYHFVPNGRGTGGPSCSTKAILAPGPNGPVATERFEAFRRGVQLEQFN